MIKKDELIKYLNDCGFEKVDNCCWNMYFNNSVISNVVSGTKLWCTKFDHPNYFDYCTIYTNVIEIKDLSVNRTFYVVDPNSSKTSRSMKSVKHYISILLDRLNTIKKEKIREKILSIGKDE